MHQTPWSPERTLPPPVSLTSQSHHEKPPEVTCTSRGKPGLTASTRERPRDDPGMKPASLMSPTLADRFFTSSATRETLSGLKIHISHIQKLVKYFIRRSAEEAESFI